MTSTETTQTIGQQLKGVRKGQRLTIHGTYLGGGVVDGRVTYLGRQGRMIMVQGHTADVTFIDPARTGCTVTR